MGFKRFQPMLVGVLSASVALGADFFEPPPAAARLKAQAAKAEVAPVIDGVLDDAVWAQAKSVGAFVEIEPVQLSKPEHQTVVKVAWNEEALFVSARLEQPGGWASFNQRDLRRDFGGNECDSFGVMLDAFGDGRNALGFQVNPWGAQRDMQVLDDSLFEPNWDTVWSSATTRDATGWTVEISIPWKSLRYVADGAPWRVQFFRRERGLNEDTAWSPFPRTVSAFRMTYAGVLEGIEPPRPRVLSLQVRPYVIGRADRVGEGPISVLPSAGGEVTWTPVSSTVVDLTVNTDFAETDVDRRVVNLSRFSVFFPERRQFFLESAGVFSAGFGGFLQPFFSRSIGLSDDGVPVPITAGVRAVYRTVDASAGALVINTLPTATTQGSIFGVARYSQNLGEQSHLGGMVVLRHDLGKADASPVTNVVPVLDGLFRAGPFTLNATLMGSSTTTDSQTTFGGAGTLSADVQGTWGNIYANAYGVSPTFDARSGFVGRPNALGGDWGANIDYRPAWLPPAIRSMGPWFDSYVVFSADQQKFQEFSLTFAPLWFLFRGGDEAWLFIEKSTQVLTETFEPVPKVSFGPGEYNYETIGAAFGSQASRKFAMGGEVATGRYYSASMMRANVHASVQPLPHVQVSASYSYNRFWGQGVTGEFADTHLLLFESRLALNPKLQLIGSYQRDTAGNGQVINARLAWEFLPLSFAYLVFTDTRAAFPAPDAVLSEQKLVLKVTYTWRP